MTQLDYAWAAGFIDGDGSFSLRAYKRYKRNMIEPVVQATQICPEPIERLYKIADGGYINDTSVTSLGKQIWRIQITGSDRLVTFLEGIYPHLVSKQKQCGLLLQVISKQRKRGGGKRYTEDEWSWFFEQKRKIEEWNAES